MLVGTNHRKILYHLMKTITISLLWIFFRPIYTRYNFVSCDMLTTSLRHELFHVNQTCNLLVIVVYDMKNVGFLKHVLKLYDNCSHRQFYIVEIV